MEQFFHELTKRNWGAPWHLAFSSFLTLFVFMVLQYFFDTPNMLYGGSFMIVVFGVGYTYELTQKDNTRRGLWEDMAMNFAGSIITLFLLFLILK